MKQLIFMVAMTLAGTAGVFLVDPFWGVFVYYLFAVLRPQFIWEWSLPAGVSWSFYVAFATIAGAVAARLGVLQVGPGDQAERTPAGGLSAVHIGLLCFAGWVVITYGTAQYHGGLALQYFLEYLKIFVMFLTATVLIRTVQQVWILFVVTGLALAYIAYEVNFLYLAYGYLGIHNNGYGGGDNNFAGLMLAMGIPICWFIYEGSPQWWRWGFLALIPVLIHAVLMTFSRGAMVAMLAGCPFLVLRSRFRVRLLLGGAVFGLLLLPTLAGPEIRARFLTIEEHEVDQSANQRKAAWSAAWKIAKDYPIFGVGVRNANYLSHQYGADEEGRTIHSQYLQILADNGFIGLALYVGLIAAAFRSTWRVRRAVADRQDAPARRIQAMASGIECSLAVYAFGSLFLSMEVFEQSYLLLLLAGQLEVLSGNFEAPFDAVVANESAALHQPPVGSLPAR